MFVHMNERNRKCKIWKKILIDIDKIQWFVENGLLSRDIASFYMFSDGIKEVIGLIIEHLIPGRSILARVKSIL